MASTDPATKIRNKANRLGKDADALAAGTSTTDMAPEIIKVADMLTKIAKAWTATPKQSIPDDEDD